MKYKSKFEEKVAIALKELPYESMKIPYIIEANYIPDFVDEEQQIIYEAKGRFTSIDRRKMLAVQKALGDDWTIIFIFQNPNAKISKRSKTTIAQWAEKNGFQWGTIK